MVPAISASMAVVAIDGDGGLHHDHGRAIRALLFLIRDAGAIPAADWDLTTKDGKPVAYRVQVSEAGGGRDQTALAGEVLHFRIGADPAAPYYGQAPLRRANLTAGMLQAVETALAEVYELAPIGTAVLPFPEAAATDLESLARGFRGNRGKVMIRESVNVAAAGGPAPMADWKPMAMTPDLARAMTATTATGPVVREGQRHLAQWCLQPIAALIGEEATDKLGEPVALDVMRPLQAYDAGGRARALSGIVAALAEAKAAYDVKPPSGDVRIQGWASDLIAGQAVRAYREALATLPRG